ncbi:MAG: cell division protein ZapA [Chitinophagaceae bacterium]
MQNLITINILIADRSYRIKIDQKDEETVRKIVRDLNDRIIEFKSKFAGRDTQDYIAMVLLWYVTQPNQLPTSDATAWEKSLQHIENLLNKMPPKEDESASQQ